MENNTINLYEHLIKTYPNDISKALIKSFNDKSYHCFWVNEEKVSLIDLENEFPHIKKHPYINNAYLYEKDEYDMGKTIYHKLGAIYIQDSASMMVPYLLDVKPGENLLDMCAAPGGKSLLTSYMMKSNGVLISNDISITRIAEMIGNIERLGASNILVINNDFSSIPISKFNMKFNKIILDAPCSGSGMIRKDIKMLDDWSYNKVLKFQEIQKSLILKAFDLLIDGGILSYSTCSYSKEEDEDVVSYLLENRSDAELVNIKIEKDFYQLNEKIGIHFLPSIFKGEGQYICLIRKKGISTINKPIYTHFLLDDTSLRDSIYFNDFKYSLPLKLNLNKLHIIRYGLKEKEIIKGMEKYDYHLSHALNSFNQVYEVNEKELEKILKGDVISSTIKGYVLLKYKNMSICFGKGDGRIIKNHLPKGLRN